MRKFKRFGAVVLAVAMVASVIPAAAGKADEPSNYSYANDYTLGWNGGIVAFQDGKQKSLEDAGVWIFDQQGDRIFKALDEQAWDAPVLTLTQPVKFTTNDGKVHEVESMLSNWNFIADPTAIDNTEVDGKLYVYGTTEGFSYSGGTLAENGYDNQSLTIMSTEDMVNWTDEGRLDSQNLTNEPSDSDSKEKVRWGKKAWAPSGLKHDGDGDGDDEYYIFYTDGGGSVVYLMGESAVGPWKDVNDGQQMFTQRSPNCSGVVWCFDPAVLRDDKGNAYCYFGGGTNSDQKNGKTGRVCKLDFVEGTGQVIMDGEPQELETYYFFEDSEINQFNGKYYYSYCTNWGMSNDPWVGGGVIAAYVSSDPMSIAFQPDGDDGDQFTDGDGVYHHFIGEILDNPSALYGQTYNNHHHMQEYKENFYIFYHSTVLNNTLHRYSQQYRNLHVDEIKVDAETDDISITPTYEGAKQIEAFNPYKDSKGNVKEINATTTSYSAGVCSRMSDSRIYDGLSPMVLDEIDTGDWTKIQGVDFGANGTKKIEVVAGSATDEAKIEIFIDDPTKAANCVGEVKLASTGDEDSFETFSADLKTTVTGTHDLYFVFRGTDYDVASWKFFEEAAAPTTAPTVAPTTAPTVAPTAAPTAPAFDYTKNYTVGKSTVKVAADGTATYVAPSKKTATSVTVPATVTVEGKSYKVTSIAANAFKNCKKLKKVTIGKNVKSIGANAFSKCKALKTVTVKSTVLKKVGKNALKGTAAKLTVKVPKKQLKAYKKLFKKSGMGKKARVK